MSTVPLHSIRTQFSIGRTERRLGDVPQKLNGSWAPAAVGLRAVWQARVKQNEGPCWTWHSPAARKQRALPSREDVPVFLFVEKCVRDVLKNKQHDMTPTCLPLTSGGADHFWTAVQSLNHAVALAMGMQ
jgi:hypothetical protein